MVMRVLILTGGTVEENFAKDYISKWNPDQVITADKGLLYAKRLNIKPDIILGDFDSCNKDIMQEFSTDKKIIVPCEKDDTDTGLAIQKAIEQLNVDKEDIEDIKVEVIEEPSKGFLGFIGAKDGLYKITLIEKQIEIKEIDIAKEFIETMLHNAKVNADVIATQEDNLIKINIKGKEATCLIGRRGETLDAVQFLTGLALNKINKDSHCRVLVDIENYREKREQSLIRYANKVAREVAKTKKTKKLDYMNPYERRIIHAELQADKYVDTHSEGEEPHRKVVITLNREFASELPRRNNYRRRNNNYSRDRKRPYQEKKD